MISLPGHNRQALDQSKLMTGSPFLVQDNVYAFRHGFNGSDLFYQPMTGTGHRN